MEGLHKRIERVIGMIIKEFRQIGRDSRVLRVLFVSPIIQLVVFGYAVSTDIRHTPLYVIDHDRTELSRGVVDALVISGYFDVVGRSDRSEDLTRSLDLGDALIGMEIPPGFSNALAKKQTPTLQLLLDGSKSNTATVARGYAELLIQSYMAHAIGRTGVTPVELRERIWYNPDLASRNYNVPAVVGGLIMLVCLLLTSLAVVREREIGTLEQLQVSPLTPGEFIIGKTIPFGLIALIDLAGVTVIALWWFDIPFRGSLMLLGLAGVLYILAGLGLGLMISIVSNTQQEAFMTSFLVFMPALLLSGFMFPVSSMPEVFQWFTYLNPVRHFIEIVRNLFLKGSGLETLWKSYLALAIIGCSLISFSVNRFHKAQA